MRKGKRRTTLSSSAAKPRSVPRQARRSGTCSRCGRLEDLHSRLAQFRLLSATLTTPHDCCEDEGNPCTSTHDLPTACHAAGQWKIWPGVPATVETRVGMIVVAFAGVAGKLLYGDFLCWWMDGKCRNLVLAWIVSKAEVARHCLVAPDTIADIFFFHVTTLT